MTPTRRMIEDKWITELCNNYNKRIPIEDIEFFLEDKIEDVPDTNVGRWISCSGCADCTHKECEHYGNI